MATCLAWNWQNPGRQFPWPPPPIMSLAIRFAYNRRAWIIGEIPSRFARLLIKFMSLPDWLWILAECYWMAGALRVDIGAGEGSTVPAVIDMQTHFLACDLISMLLLRIWLLLHEGLPHVIHLINYSPTSVIAPYTLVGGWLRIC